MISCVTDQKNIGNYPRSFFKYYGNNITYKTHIQDLRGSILGRME